VKIAENSVRNIDFLQQKIIFKLYFISHDDLKWPFLFFVLVHCLTSPKLFVAIYSFTEGPKSVWPEGRKFRELRKKVVLCKCILRMNAKLLFHFVNCSMKKWKNQGKKTKNCLIYSLFPKHFFSNCPFAVSTFLTLCCEIADKKMTFTWFPVVGLIIA
jgi:hypothetical protein